MKSLKMFVIAAVTALTFTSIANAMEPEYISMGSYSGADQSYCINNLGGFYSRIPSHTDGAVYGCWLSGGV